MQSTHTLACQLLFLSYTDKTDKLIIVCLDVGNVSGVFSASINCFG